MGTKVLAAAKENTKPNYVVSTVVAGSMAVLDGEFAIWIGATASTQLESYNDLLQCSQALREAGWPNPVTTEFSTAALDTKTGVLTVTNGTAQVLTEDQVAVVQGFDFSFPHESNSAHVRRMQESWLEDVAKAA